MRSVVGSPLSPRADDGSHKTPVPRDGVAVFDLDRTLIPGSSLALFGRELVRRGMVRRTTVARHGLQELAFRRRGLDAGRLDSLVARLLHAAAGEPYEPLRQIARSMGPELADQVPLAARWLLERHLSRGDFVIVLSASPHELVEAITTELGAHRAVGTRLEVRRGALTGRLDGPFCYGIGKLECLEREVGPIDLSLATAYADSGSDLPLLERCGTAIAVNPDRELRRWAERARWPMVHLG